ncbi:MAG: T9SS type A sorting domain-containing protein [Bacteroidetes bacterium]|nr:T9SS type A sorting domain-containing protein [Bacteroidota bacterium]
MSNRHLVLTLLCLLLTIPLLAADNFYNVKVEQAVAGGFLDVSVYVGQASPSFVLATSGFRLGYNSSALGNPVRIGADDGPWDQQTDADYANMSLTLYDGPVVELNTKFVGGLDYTGALVPTTGWTRVGTIRFSILNSALPSGLAWSNPVVYRVNSPGSQPPLEILYTFAGDFTPPGEQPLPITLTSFAGMPASNGDGVELTWSTLSEVDNYGFSVQRRMVGDESFVGIPNSFVAGAGTTTEPRSYTFVDQTVVQPGRYEYRLVQLDRDGTEWFSETITVNFSLTDIQDSELPIDPRLVQNFPNPFNPETTIQYGTDSRTMVRVEVYSVLGQRVRTLVNAEHARGHHVVRWDGTDDNGRQVNSGAYLCRVVSGGQVGMTKMLLMR